MRNYLRRCSGASAGINSAAFWTCPDCGACIVEMEHGTGTGDEGRRIHTRWHDRLDPRALRSSP